MRLARNLRGSKTTNFEEKSRFSLFIKYLFEISLINPIFQRNQQISEFGTDAVAVSGFRPTFQIKQMDDRVKSFKSSKFNKFLVYHIS